ncbi:glutaminyl-peptide cyclotransferase [Leeuwenhoekiella sp. MAR_2009_132]|uniref:glutaminyl-peptide cyclotransferase n=1 Tax=Leeuwenhoekiella sp. MAR_2009_132 TaxID=1392489 RepID=UPI00048F42BF|nr:glutaminyl-peptide cyclotransferase [Leeuwenhoekiella sp. MAR_2009_132]
MRIYNLLVIFVLSAIVTSCGNGKDISKSFSIALDKPAQTLINGESLNISLKSKGDIEIDSVTYYLDDFKLGHKKDNSPLQTEVKSSKLGTKELKAEIFVGGKSAIINTTLTFVSSQTPSLYTYEIINTYPHNTESYTQGLEFHNDTLYESVGEYGHSALLKTDLATGAILNRIDLDKSFFAEGLTIINSKIIQLTWQSNQGFIYDLNTFKKEGTFQYSKSKEGWGLCNDGQKIYKSDGTEKIWILDSKTLAEQDYIQVVDSKKLRSKFNELEWVDGKIYANSYQFDSISIINPETGAIEGVVDLRPLKKEIKTIKDTGNEVLNGIAYNQNTNKLYVTGKHWDKLFEIRILKK